MRVYRAPRVDMLIHFIVHDETKAAGWQSGFFTAGGKVKPSFDAWRFPLAISARRGTRSTLWGQIRPRSGRQTYRLQVFRGGRWRTLAGEARTDTRGFFTRSLLLPSGSRVRVYSIRDRAASPPWRSARELFVWLVRFFPSEGSI